MNTFYRSVGQVYIERKDVFVQKIAVVFGWDDGGSEVISFDNMSGWLPNTHASIYRAKFFEYILPDSLSTSYLCKLCVPCS